MSEFGQERSFENPADFEFDSIKFLDRDSMKALCKRGPEMANGGYPRIRQVAQEVVALETIVGAIDSPLRPRWRIVLFVCIGRKGERPSFEQLLGFDSHRQLLLD